MIFKALLIGHFFGDFFFQSGKMAREKTEKKSMMVMHCIISFLWLVIMAALFLPMGVWGKAIGVLMAVSTLHGLIDTGKYWLNKQDRPCCPGYLLFVADQILHIGLLYTVVRVWGLQATEASPIYQVFDSRSLEQLLMPLLAGLICWKPASVFISKIFQAIPTTVSLADGMNPCENQTCPYRPENEEGIKIGSWIGILEREIILILGLMNQFSAVGFVIAAKSLARYKQLENKAFAEKYLVGTLISAIIAMVCVAMCKYI